MKYMEEDNTQKSASLSSHGWENTVPTDWIKAQEMHQ